jgi:hypothetical protein
MDDVTGRDFHSGGGLQSPLAPKSVELCGVSKPAGGSLRRNTDPNRFNLSLSLIRDRFARFF